MLLACCQIIKSINRDRKKVENHCSESSIVNVVKKKKKLACLRWNFKGPRTFKNKKFGRMITHTRHNDFNGVINGKIWSRWRYIINKSVRQTREEALITRNLCAFHSAYIRGHGVPHISWIVISISDEAFRTRCGK